MPYRKIPGKAHTNEKQERNKLLLLYIREYPNATFAEIGKAFNISSARVQQIIKAKRQ